MGFVTSRIHQRSSNRHHFVGLQRGLQVERRVIRVALRLALRA